MYMRLSISKSKILHLSILLNTTYENDTNSSKIVEKSGTLKELEL